LQHETEPTLAGEGLAFIGRIYDIERCDQCAGPRRRERGLLRQREARPILDKFRAWLEVTITKVLPAGPLANPLATAIEYARAAATGTATERGRFIVDEAVETSAPPPLRG
jgi:hypothetical protein